MLGSAAKEVEGSWSSVICSRLGGKPSRPSTSSREELEAGAAAVTAAAEGAQGINDVLLLQHDATLRGLSLITGINVRIIRITIKACQTP